MFMRHQVQVVDPVLLPRQVVLVEHQDPATALMLPNSYLYLENNISWTLISLSVVILHRCNAMQCHHSQLHQVYTRG